MVDTASTQGADAEAPNSNEIALEVEGLKTYFFTKQGVVKAVDGVSFYLRKGETLGIVGESGCGKSITALSLMRLVPNPPGKILGGKVVLDGVNLLELEEAEMRKVRGNDISMIFQEPMTSLDPLMPIGRQIEETLELHSTQSKKQRTERIETLLSEVRFDDPAKIAGLFPHELSGGMRQRAMIAMALANNPTLLIADEPTTALDVTIQREVMEIIQRLRQKHGLSVLFISHDLSLVHQYTERVGVLYGGVLMETGPEADVIGRSAHPYTEALLNCAPGRRVDGERRQGIPGTVPSPLDWDVGCRFRDRCARADAACAEAPIPVKELSPQWRARCLRPSE